MTTPTHIPALDGLRGLAALSVVVSHAANAGLLPGVLGAGFGQMGVALFYALSGFLMGHLYFGQAATPQALAGFLLRRAARILPLFYVILAVTVILRLGFGIVLYEVWSPDILIRNAALLQGSSVLWSVPVEGQFYLGFAVLWWASASLRLRPGTVLTLALTGQFGVLLVLHLAGLSDGGRTIGHWGHLFLAGLALAIWRPETGGRAGPWVILLPIALPEIRRGLGIPVGEAYLDPISLGVPLILLWLVLRQAPGLRWLGTAPCRWLGGLSFGLYLIHQPVIDLAVALGGGFPFVLALSLGLAWLARALIERPAQGWARRCGAGAKWRQTPRET